MTQSLLALHTVMQKDGTWKLKTHARQVADQLNKIFDAKFENWDYRSIQVDGKNGHYAVLIKRLNRYWWPITVYPGEESLKRAIAKELADIANELAKEMTPK